MGFCSAPSTFRGVGSHSLMTLGAGGDVKFPERRSWNVSNDICKNKCRMKTMFGV